MIAVLKGLRVGTANLSSSLSPVPFLQARLNDLFSTLHFFLFAQFNHFKPFSHFQLDSFPFEFQSSTTTFAADETVARRRKWIVGTTHRLTRDLVGQSCSLQLASFLNSVTFDIIWSPSWVGSHNVLINFLERSTRTSTGAVSNILRNYFEVKCKLDVSFITSL